MFRLENKIIGEGTAAGDHRYEFCVTPKHCGTWTCILRRNALMWASFSFGFGLHGKVFYSTEHQLHPRITGVPFPQKYFLGGSGTEWGAHRWAVKRRRT